MCVYKIQLTHVHLYSFYSCAINELIQKEKKKVCFFFFILFRLQFSQPNKNENFFTLLFILMSTHFYIEDWTKLCFSHSKKELHNFSLIEWLNDRSICLVFFHRVLCGTCVHYEFLYVLVSKKKTFRLFMDFCFSGDVYEPGSLDQKWRNM